MDNKKTIATIATLTAIGTAGTQVTHANEVSTDTTNATPTVVDKKVAEVTEAQVATAQVTATQTQKNVDEQQTKVDQQTEIVKEKTADVQDKKEKLATAETDVKEATPENIATAKGNVKQSKETVEAKKTAVSEKENTVTKVATTITDQNQTVAKAKDEVDNAQSEVNDAKAKVNQAQSILDGTGAKEVIGKAEQTQAKVNADKQAVENAETRLAEAKKADGERSTAIKQAKNDVSTKEATANQADKTLREASEKAEQTSTTLAEKQADFTKAEADFKATNTLVVPAEYIEALKAYKNFDDLSEAGDKKREEAEQRLKAMNDKLVGLNKFNSNANDKGITLTLGSLTDEQKMELNFFANDLLNQIREAFGTNKVTISKGAVNFADEVADRYVADNWDWDKVISEGHDKEAIKELARKNGLFEGQFYENMNTLYGSRPTITMNRAKEMIFEAFNDFLFNGMEWEHAGSVSGVTSMEDKKQYMGIALSSRKNATGVHLITVAESLIREGSSFDKTPVINPNTKEVIEARYNDARSALNQATTEFNNAKSALKNAENSKKQADDELAVAKKTLAEKEAVKEQTPEAQAILDKAQDDLVKSTNDNETAQKAVAELNADIQAKQAKLEQAKAVLSAKQQVLDAKKVTLKAEQGKLAKLEAELQTAKTNLETAKAELKDAEKALVEAEKRVQDLENAPVKLAEAQKALDEAENKLAEAQKVLEMEQSKLAELTVKRDEAKATYEAIKAQFDKQEEAKKQAELERKREELAKQGIQSIPVISTTGKVIDYVAQEKPKNEVKLAIQNGTQFIESSSEEATAYTAPATVSDKHLPVTGEKVSVLAYVGVSLLVVFGLGVQKKKEGN